jgi:alanine racemase
MQVHLEVDTGMSRTGVPPAEVQSFVEQIEALGNVTVEGIYTHFADPMFNPAFTDTQMRAFETAAMPYKGKKLLHISGSAGVLRKYGNQYCDLIRPGWML